jgi:hypothetical protein
MIQDLTAQAVGVMRAAVKAKALGQQFNVTAAPGTVPQADEQGNITGLTVGWTLVVSVPHPRPNLKGPRTMIASSFPLPGILPPDDHFEQVATRLFDNCMAEVDKINATPAAVGMDLGGLKLS